MTVQPTAIDDWPRSADECRVDDLRAVIEHPEAVPVPNADPVVDGLAAELA